jgi:hypothetical protein
MNQSPPIPADSMRMLDNVRYFMASGIAKPNYAHYINLRQDIEWRKVANSDDTVVRWPAELHIRLFSSLPLAEHCVCIMCVRVNEHLWIPFRARSRSPAEIAGRNSWSRIGMAIAILYSIVTRLNRSNSRRTRHARAQYTHTFTRTYLRLCRDVSLPMAFCFALRNRILQIVETRREFQIKIAECNRATNECRINLVWERDVSALRN